MMLFGNTKLDHLRRLVARSPHAEGIARDIVARADDISGAAAVERRLDDRGTMLDISRLVGERVFTLGTAWAVTGNPAFRRRIVSEILAAAAFPDWNRQHFLDAAEMAAAVAIGRDWSRDVMTKAELAAVDDAILRLGLHPGLHSLHGGSGWTTARTNWTLVCSGGLIVAAALLRSTHPETCDEILDLALVPLQSGLSAFDAEGGWPEGATYGEYGARYAILALEALREAGLSHRAPPETERLQGHWRFQRALVGPSGLVFNAGDEPDVPERSPMLGWFAAATGDDAAADWQWNTVGGVHPFDLVWYHPPREPSPPNETFWIDAFEAGYVTLRRHAGGTEWYLAARAGRNKTNHSHADLGSFVLDVGKSRFVCDLGREDYAAPGYFDPARRTSYFLTQTRAHNVAFAVEQSVDAEAIVAAGVPGGARVALDIRDPASPFLHLRGFVALEPGGMIVADLIVPKNDTSDISVLWQCHTTAEAFDKDGRVLLDQEGRSIMVQLHAPEACPLTIEQTAAESERFPHIRRLTARLTVPMDGLFVACIFAYGDEGASAVPAVAAWMRQLAGAQRQERA